ncbi:hypothetical protein AgCh_026135 [Apium graveolens]
MVTNAVEKAMEAMRHSLTHILMEGQTLATKKMRENFEALTGRLEGRVKRSVGHRNWRYRLLDMPVFDGSDPDGWILRVDREVNPEYQKWGTKLLGFDFEIQYKIGTSNRVADALSRKNVGEVVLSALVTTPVVHWKFLDKEIKEDSVLQRIIKDLQTKEREHPEYTLVENILLYKGCCVIPQKYTLIKENHDIVMGGHTGELKTNLCLETDWYWAGMRKEFASYVQRCLICQQNKASQRSPAGLLQPLPIPTHVWSDISMDFVEGLPLLSGIDTVLVLVHRLTKYAHFLGLKHPFDTFKVATLFIREVVRLHGFQSSIISGRDRIYLSTFWCELFKLDGTTLKKSTSYHPQTDGQSEIVNKGLETYLRVGTGQTVVGSIEELLQEHDAILDELRFNLIKVQQVMKLAVDSKHRDESFEADDLVYLKLQLYRQRSLARRSFEKLDAQYYGPYRVVKRIGKLKRSIENFAASPELPPQLSTELELLVESETLLEVRQVRVGNALRLEALIKWKNMSSFESTWEDVTLLNMQFPAFHLEDKVELWGGGIMMHSNAIGPLKTYFKRKKMGKKVVGPDLTKDNDI